MRSPLRLIKRRTPSRAPDLGLSFVNVARESGLNAKTIFGGEHKNKYLLETTGCGVAFYDYDNDGWLDIFLVNGSRLEGFPKGQEPTSHLFKNNRDGTFTDVTAKAGVAHSGWGQGVCIGDYDNDGYEDLFVTYFGKNVLYHNNGDGTFTDVSEKAGVAGKRQTLEHRLRVRRLRSRWQARSVRRQLHRSRSRDSARAGVGPVPLQERDGRLRAARA